MGPTRPLQLQRLSVKKNEIVLKTRAVFDKKGYKNEILAGTQYSKPSHRDFVALFLRHQAEPKILVRYEREAWVSAVNVYARVTFDYNLTFQQMTDWNIDGDEALNRPIDDPNSVGEQGSGAILELKFEAGEAPLWMKTIVQKLGLIRVGFSKYCTGIEHAWIHDRGFFVGARVSQCTPYLYCCSAK